ncbi:hypothetical protein [Brevibacillus sp. SYSU BS000544]|uniref:hypothetical protein n=1 Tax=Brevibacillus sp. SYSU BS000544 TaxID=3416443 RepID=UPI003CE4D33F
MKKLLKYFTSFLLFFLLLLESVIAAPAPLDSEITIVNQHKLAVGKSVKVIAKTENVGTVSDIKFEVYANKKRKSLTKVKTSTEDTFHFTEGYFTPTETGNYDISFYMDQIDTKGKTIYASGVISVRIIDKSQIDITVSPSTATLQRGDEVFFVIKYNADPSIEYTFESNYSFNLEEVSAEYDKSTGYYKKIVKFIPAFRHNALDFSVKQVIKGKKREGKTYSTITVE